MFLRQEMLVELDHDPLPRPLQPSLLKTLLSWQDGHWVVDLKEVLEPLLFICSTENI